jgi:hypothetical protein
MSDPPRQAPPPFPRLSVQQRGNFISVRQKPDQDGGWGTLLNPKRLELPLLSPHRIKSRLGFEAVPSSEFWQFTVPGKVRLQVNRLSKDRYASSVGVALLDQGNRRVAPLVQSASGRGAPVEIEAGTYKVVASLGIAENLKDLVFEFFASPVGASLQSCVALQLQGIGRLIGTATGLRGQAVVTAVLTGDLRLSNRRHPQGQGLMAVQGNGQLGGALRSLQGTAALQASSSAQLLVRRVARLRGKSVTAMPALGSLAAVRWLQEPQQPWRARIQGSVLELNAAYIRFSGSSDSQRAVLQAIADALV